MSHSEDRLTTGNSSFPNDPISLIEEYTLDQDWFAERSNDHELWVEMPGQWGQHRLWVAFHEDTHFLQFNCYLNIKIPDRLVPAVAELITLMNERIWLGHFEIWSEEMVPVFRVVLPLRGNELEAEQVEDVMTSIFQETERFFPAFNWVVWGGKSPTEAVTAAIVDTEGEA